MASRRDPRRHRALRTGALALGALLAGCAGDGKGLDANGRPPGESGAGLPPATGATFKAVQDNVLTPFCTGCHAGASAPLGLRLDAGNSYALLVNVASVEVGSLKRVLPGDPGNSYLVQKLEGRAAVGARMPLGGAALSQANIDLVRAWIAAGAPTAEAPGAVAAKAFAVTSTIPAAGEVALADTHSLTLVFSSGVDAALAQGGTIELARVDGPAVALAAIEVSAANPAVLTLRSAAALPAGDYLLTLRGSGATALADLDARRLDGDGDGVAGGDFSIGFSVAAPAAGATMSSGGQK
jgi:methionine-rich copper-binding protein CopC